MPSFIEIPYEDALPGDVGFLAGVGLISDAIRAAEQVGGELTDSAFQPSHAFIFAQDAILEAVYPRVALRPQNEYAGLSTRVFRGASVPKLSVDDALREIETRWLGRPYDLIGVIGVKRSMSLIELEEAFGDHQTMTNRLASGQSVWCSELAADFIDTYLAPVPALVGSVTSPAKLYNWVRG